MIGPSTINYKQVWPQTKMECVYIKFMENHEIDFLAIGDITTDAFIKLKDAEVNCDVDKHNCKISMSFRDKIPYESVTVVPAVGNSPNAAVSAARLGLKTAIYTNIGDDQNGAECLAQLVKEKIDTSFVIAQKDKITNYHYVLWFQDERTISLVPPKSLASIHCTERASSA